MLFGAFGDCCCCSSICCSTSQFRRFNSMLFAHAWRVDASISGLGLSCLKKNADVTATSFCTRRRLCSGLKSPLVVIGTNSVPVKRALVVALSKPRSRGGSRCGGALAFVGIWAVLFGAVRVRLTGRRPGLWCKTPKDFNNLVRLFAFATG